MTQEKANEIFKSDLGRQLYEIYVTSDDYSFIRLFEAQNHCHDILEEGDDMTKYNITIWYPEN